MKSNNAFVFALAGSAINLTGALVGVILFGFWTGFFSVFTSYTLAYFLNYILTVWGIIFGIISFIGAIMMQNSKNLKTYGTLVLIFNIFGILSLQGFIIGPILGIIGGNLGRK